MLKPHQDAYGQMRGDHFRGQRTIESDERNGGRIERYIDFPVAAYVAVIHKKP